MVLNEFSEKVENTTSNVLGEDITDEVEVDKSEVDIYGIRELVPSSAPITIPYMEVYRTNELEYVPYLSPYNVGASSDSSDSGEENNLPTETTGTDSNSDDNGSSSGNEDTDS